MFVLLYFFFWPLCCLFFFDIRILITPLVSSNSSCPFVLFLLAIVLSVLLRYTDSDYHFGIFKLFLFMLFIFIYVYWNTISISDVIFSFNSYTTGVTSGARITYPSGAPEFGFQWGSCCSIFSFLSEFTPVFSEICVARSITI